MKKCSLCGEIKPLTEFSPNRARNGHQARCKPCRRRSYPANPETTKRYRAKHRDQLNAAQQQRYEHHRAKITQLKLWLPCVDCGWRPETVEQTSLLDFDHIDPTTKHEAGTGAFLYSWSWPRIEAELAKCEPRCKPCHARRTGALGHNDWRARNRREEQSA